MHLWKEKRLSMIDFITPLIFLCQLGVIAGVLVFHFASAKEWNRQQEKLVTALLSKDATEYAHAVKTEKELPEQREDPGIVELANASEEEFDKHIKAATS